MAPSSLSRTETKWSSEFDTARREKLFRNPPKDHTAYPSLAAAIEPHIHSFNAILDQGGLLEQAIRDIGTKVFLDGDPNAQPEDRPQRNRLSVRIRDVFLDKSTLPIANKFALKNRSILPAECRERHATYRGRLRIRLEYRVNQGDWHESVREMGQVPIMLRVCSFQILFCIFAMLTNALSCRRIAAILRV